MFMAFQSAIKERMAEPSNADVMREVQIVRRQIDRLLRNLPALARLTADGDLRAREQEKARRRREDSLRVARGSGH